MLAWTVWTVTRRAGAATCVKPTGLRRGSRHGRTTPSRWSCRTGSRPTRACCTLSRPRTTSKPRTTAIAWSAGPTWPRGAECRCERTRSSIRSRCRPRPPVGSPRTGARARRRAPSTRRTPKSSPPSRGIGQPRRRTAGSAFGTASAGIPLARSLPLPERGDHPRSSRTRGATLCQARCVQGRGCTCRSGTTSSTRGLRRPSSDSPAWTAPVAVPEHLVTHRP